MQITTSQEVDKLNISLEAKERAKEILWNKGSEALKAFLESVKSYATLEAEALEILKALYPKGNDTFYQRTLRHLKGLGVIEGRARDPNLF